MVLMFPVWLYISIRLGYFCVKVQLPLLLGEQSASMCCKLVSPPNPFTTQIELCRRTASFIAHDLRVERLQTY